MAKGIKRGIKTSGLKVRHAVALLACAAIGASVLVATPARTDAATPTAIVGRDFAVRYSNNVNGQIAIAANTMVQCPLSTPDPVNNAGCAGARAGTNARNNNSFDMKWVDVDSDPSTFDSTSANLAIPAGGRVLFAGLYWTGIQKKGDLISGSNGYVGTPLNPPDASAIGRVKLMTPNEVDYRTVVASQIDLGPISVGSGYGSFADVTGLVSESGPGTYTVADVQTGTGGNIGAGWSLVVAYADPSEPLRNLSVFDGLKVVSSSNYIDIPLSGFKTPSTGTVRTTMGVVAAEGDAGATGDYLTLNNQLLTDAVHPSNNTENSTIANRGSLVTTKNPNWANQLGYDSSLFTVDGVLPNGATTAIFRAKTTSDTYAPQAVTFATELFSPQVDLQKTATISGDAEPGATIHYEITATNNGVGVATNVELDDPIPAGTTLSAGPTVTNGLGNATLVGGTVTARLGAGANPTSGGTLAPAASATVSFDVVIDGDRPLGDVIENLATLGFVSPDLGLPISTVAAASVTVVYPDPGVTKTLRSSSNNDYTFDLVVTNEGTIPTVGPVTLADTLGINHGSFTIGGPGWTCASGGTQSPCTRSDTLAPGDSYPALTVVAAFAPGLSVENDATVSGGGQPTDAASLALLNDNSSATAGLSPSAELSINKSAVLDIVDVGELAAFRIQIRNNGPSAAVNAVLTDSLPAGLEFVEASTPQGSCTEAPGGGGAEIVTCALGSLEVGDDVLVIVTTRPNASVAGETLINTASVTSDITVVPATDTATVEVRAATDLALDKTASVAVANPDDTLNYTVTATNIGSQSAEELEIVDAVPSAMDASSLVATPSSGGTCTITDNVVSCLWPGATAPTGVRSVAIDATVNSVVSAIDRDALNEAVVSTLTTDLNPSNDSASALVQILPLADLQITASGGGIVAPGGSAVFTFTVVNNGPSSATSPDLVITIPAGLEVSGLPAFCSAAANILSCSLDSMDSGATFAVEIGVFSASAPIGTVLEAEASVESAVDDPIPDNNYDVTPLTTTAPPVIDAVEPPSGPETGGISVTITGDGLTTETTVALGGSPCTPVIFMTSNELICTAGPHEPGVVDVVVTNADGQSATLPSAFTYTKTPDGEPVSPVVNPSFTG